MGKWVVLLFYVSTFGISAIVVSEELVDVDVDVDVEVAGVCSTVFFCCCL